ncbi:MAG: hypothetical protein WDZ49_12535 [Litorilinea sp.]
MAINKKTISALALLVGMMLFTSACGMVSSLLSGRSSGTVGELWDDVPPVAGAAKADMEMPLAARLAIQAMLQGRMDFIAFSTDQTPTQVQEIYTREAMEARGWNVEEGQGCVGDSADENMGAICFFAKNQDGQEEGLAIVVALDEETGTTNIFYARIDLTEEATE